MLGGRSTVSVYYMSLRHMRSRTRAVVPIGLYSVLVKRGTLDEHSMVKSICNANRHVICVCVC